MGAGNWFWIIYVLMILLSGVLWWPFPAESRRAAGVSLILLILVGLLGWGIFGPPIK